MEILEMIAEWRKGCSCSVGADPSTCSECTNGLVSAIANRVDDEQNLILDLLPKTTQFLDPPDGGSVTPIGAAKVAEMINRTKPISPRPCCPDCGENLQGDGFTTVIRCPNADPGVSNFCAPDDGPFYCGYYDPITDRNKRPEPPEPPPPRTTPTI